MLASTGEESSQVIVAAIVSNVWAQYAKLSDQGLEYMLLDQEVRPRPEFFFSNTPTLWKQKGRVVVTKVSSLLLCIYGDKSAEFGMLKRKVGLARTNIYQQTSTIPGTHPSRLFARAVATSVLGCICQAQQIFRLAIKPLSAFRNGALFFLKKKKKQSTLYDG